MKAVAMRLSTLQQTKARTAAMAAAVAIATSSSMCGWSVLLVLIAPVEPADWLYLPARLLRLPRGVQLQTARTRPTTTRQAKQP